MSDKSILKFYLGACVLIVVLFMYLILVGIYKIIFIFLVMLTLAVLIHPGVRKVLSKTLCDLIR
jgi:uncharacterized membrane protein YccC